MKDNNNILEAMDIENAIFEELPSISTEVAEEEEASLDTLYEHASIAKRVLSAALMSDSMKAIVKAREKVKQAVDKYNSVRLDELYKGYLSNENPCLEALKVCYCRVLTCNETKKDGVIKVELDFTTKIIDLKALDNAAGSRIITNNAAWKVYVEKLALVYALRATADIGGNTEEMQRTYKMSEQARKLDIGVQTRKPDPASNRSLVTATQEAVDAILHIDAEDGKNTLHITTKDVSFLLYTMFRRGKKELTVSMPRTSTVISALTEVMYKLINGKCYSAEYDKIETKEA